MGTRKVLRRRLFAQLHHVLVGQDVVLAAPLRLVLGTAAPHPGVGKLRQDTLVQAIAKFFNGWIFRVQNHRLGIVGDLALGLLCETKKQKQSNKMPE